MLFYIVYVHSNHTFSHFIAIGNIDNLKEYAILWLITMLKVVCTPYKKRVINKRGVQMINCRKLIRITSRYNLKPLAGKSGHNRIISWFHYVENPDYMEWLKGNEMILTTGMFMDGKTQNLLDFIQQLFEHDAAGLILNLSPFLKTIPKEALELGDFLGFPLFELEAHIRIVDISECICTAIVESAAKQNLTESFFSSLIQERTSVTDKTIRKAISYGFSQEDSYQTVLLDFLRKPNPSASLLNTQDTRTMFQKTLNKCFKSIDASGMQDLLFYVDQNQIVLIYPTNNSSNLLVSMDTFISHIKTEHQTIEVYGGISGIWQGLEQFYTSYDEAHSALRFIPLSEQGKQYLKYEDLDLSSLLFLSKPITELSSLYSRVLKDLIESEQNASLDLISTLEQYLIENANLNKTAETLFIHVNTLRYRLKKIEHLLDCDLKNANTLFSLQLALRMKRYVEYTLQS